MAGATRSMTFQENTHFVWYRTWVVAELVLTMATFLVGVWWIGPVVLQSEAWFKGFILAMLALAALYLAYASPALIHRDPLPERGLGSWKTGFIRTDNLAAALRAFGGITLGGVVLLSGIAIIRRPDVFLTLNWHAFGVKMALYFFSALGQGLYFTFLLTRLRHVIPVGSGIAGSSRTHRLAVSAVMAVFFSLCHAPNPPLMLLALVGGACWFWAYYMHPNLFALALSHAVLGTMLHRIVQLHTRIGPFYGNRSRHIWCDLLPFVERWIGNLF